MRILPGRWALLALISSLTLACGGTEDGGPAADTAQGAETGVPRIHFGADWSRTQSADLIAGGQVRVSYDAARLGSCRGEANGHPAWSITAYARLNDGGVVSQTIHGLTPDGHAATGEAVFDLPVAGELSLWFEITNRWGCSQFDSDFGHDFRFSVGAPVQARLVFDRAWDEQQEGALRAGGTALIEYDLARLPSCRSTYRGYVSWDLVAYYRFDGGEATRLTITRGSTDRYSVPTALAIPREAHQLELWFHNSDSNGCSQYDSDFGKNYVFVIER